MNEEIAKCAALHDPKSFLALIAQTTPEATELRLKLRSEIQKRISRIDLEFQPTGRVEGQIIYVNGVKGDRLIFRAHGTLLIKGRKPVAIVF